MRRPWNKFINADNAHLCTPEALDFCDRLLRYDHAERMTAKEALDHPWLAPVKETAAKRRADEEAATAAAKGEGGAVAAAAAAAAAVVVTTTAPAT